MQRKAYQRIALELPLQPSSSLSEEYPQQSPGGNSNGNTNGNASDGGCWEDHDYNYNEDNYMDEDDLQYVHQNGAKIRRGLGVSFWIAGVLNNAGYVIMIAAAKSISEGGVALVFLANILPALVVKSSAPYWFEKVSYSVRMRVATALMVASFGIVASSTSLAWQLFGVACTSAQGSLGEASLLALAGKIDGELAHTTRALEKRATTTKSTKSNSKGLCLNGFSSGTGFAGVFGFFWVWFWSELWGHSLSVTLWWAMGLAVGYLSSYRTVTRLQRQHHGLTARMQSRGSFHSYRDDETNDNDGNDREIDGKSSDLDETADPSLYGTQYKDKGPDGSHNSSNNTTTTASAVPVREISSMTGLERFSLVLSLWPYMVPLFTVYVAEYTLQAGTWTAIGFPVTSQKSRDRFYQLSNWIYQAGVFVSRSSGTCLVAPMMLLWLMPVLQCLNVVVYWSIAAHQQDDTTSMANDMDVITDVDTMDMTGDAATSSFWASPYFLYPTALYSGLLGGAVYIHGYLRICKDLPLEYREFALSATSLAECLGIVVADVLGLLVQACLYQINGLEGAAMACPKTNL